MFLAVIAALVGSAVTLLIGTAICCVPMGLVRAPLRGQPYCPWCLAAGRLEWSLKGEGAALERVTPQGQSTDASSSHLGSFWACGSPALYFPRMPVIP